MATQLDDLADLLAHAAGTAGWERIRSRIEAAVAPKYTAGDLALLVEDDGGDRTATRAQWRGWLTRLEAADPAGVTEIHRILTPADPDGTAEDRTRAAPRTIDSIRNTLSDTTVNEAVSQYGYVGSVHHHRYVTGDNVEVTGNTVHGDMIGFQNTTNTTNHYGGSPPAAHDWRPVREVGPAEFGVRPGRRVAGLPVVPAYVARDHDAELADRLAHPGFVLLLADPLSGTSHTVWNAVTRLDGRRLYTPGPGTDLRALPALLADEPGVYRTHRAAATGDGSGRYVLWLDALHDHYDPLGRRDGRRGLDAALLGRLHAQGVVVLATMTAAEYRELRTDRLVATADTVRVPHRWSTAEHHRMRRTHDPRLFEAADLSGHEGAAAYLALGHHLRDELNDPGTRTAHPRGHRLVRTAVDLARCGVREAVSEDLLKRLHERHDDEPGPATGPRPAPQETFDEARHWATRFSFGVAGLSLLVPGTERGTWRVHGALTTDLPAAPDDLWLRTIEEATWEDGVDMDALVGRYCAVLRPRAGAGDVHSMVKLGALLDDRTEAAHWYRRAADAGNAEAAAALGDLMLIQHRWTEAITCLEAAVEAGHKESARLLGRVLQRRAEHWLGVAADAGDSDAALLLARMRVGAGRTDEEIRLLNETLERRDHDPTSPHDLGNPGRGGAG
ncbi:hypothetical protein ACFYVL_11590 [Streptomyces sp. NPDC004111]|uniref:hypothetical protein n=1 Tax=Streptomyces sp. NPDC004111 TaxID=3364690 RepID=UPI0036B35FEF